MKTGSLLALLLIALAASGQESATVQPFDRTRQKMNERIVHVLKGNNGIVIGSMKPVSGSNVMPGFSKVSLKYPLPAVRSMVQVVDSVYDWTWDLAAQRWQIDPVGKTTDIHYDSKHNMTEYTYRRLTGGNWDNQYRNLYTFDGHDNMLSETYQSWNGTGWYDNNRHLYTYNSADSLLSDTYQMWDGSTWLNMSSSVHVYDSHGNRLSETLAYWGAGVWTNSGRTVYTYDARDNMLSETDQSWNGNAWANSHRTTYTYDSHDYRISETYQSWNVTRWINEERFVSSYNAHGLKTLDIYQLWNGAVWDDYGRIQYSYDGHDNLLIGNLQVLIGTVWENFMRIVFAYDMNDNLLSEFIENWSGTQWLPEFEFHFTWDANSFMTTYSYKSYDVSGSYVESGDSSSYYFHTVIGIGELASWERKIMLYPNPADGEVVYLKTTDSNASNMELEIYSSDGRLLRTEKNVSAQKEIDVRDLPAGSYLLVFRTEEGTESHRLVVGRSE